MSNISTETINDALHRAKQLAAVNSNGQKRTLNEDLNLHPAKRSNGPMAGMGLGGPVSTGEVVETMDIPEQAVGLVIGRGGEQITFIQQNSGCRVQMAPDNSPTGFRSCTLQGQKMAVDKARKMVNEVIDRTRMGGNLVANTQSINHSNGSTLSTDLLIPGPKCGLIIGKNGETIKGLQESIGVKMLLIQDSQQVSMGPKPLRITGIPEKVEHAKRVIEQLLNNEDSSGGNSAPRTGGPRSIGEVIVPRSSVGIIIGKGGETIKRLAQDSGAKIQFKPDENPNAQDRCAVIQGTPDQINRATQMISDLVTRSAQSSTATEVFYMHVPANKTGLVIGKGGDTIKQICAETGAHVELSREPPPNPNEKVFVIKGTAYQIHHVQHIIRIKVGDIPPGTPVPPFHGAVGGAPAATAIPAAANLFGGATHQFGVAADQFSNAGQLAQNGKYNFSQDSAWSHYYQQQQQAGLIPGAAAAAAPQNYAAPGAGPQSYPSPYPAAVGVPQQVPQQAQSQQHLVQQTMPQQQQVPSTAPAINPATGQPDYSAQWAEYYRTMGMHDQANLIESQMKQQQQTAAGGARPQMYYNS